MGGTPCAAELEENANAMRSFGDACSLLAAHASFLANAQPTAVAKFTSDLQTAMATVETSLADLHASVSLPYPLS